jgi:hypothetical protein
MAKLFPGACNGAVVVVVGISGQLHYPQTQAGQAYKNRNGAGTPARA